MIDRDAGEPLWFGMPPGETEQGLGRYRTLGQFPAGTQVVVPMTTRGETMRVTIEQPMKLCGFRFEIYFRGLWFEALSEDVTDLGMRIAVEEMPERRAGPMTVFEDPVTGTVSLLAGGTPLLQSISLPSAGDDEPGGGWSWQGDESAGAGEAVLPAAGDASITIPGHLRGSAVSVRSPDGTVTDRVGGAPLRLGADLSPVTVSAGGIIEFSPTALEQVTINADRETQMDLACEGDGLSRLALRSLPAGARLTFGYSRASDPAPDDIASRPAPYAEEPRPGPYGGVSVQTDSPDPGDVTVRTPWWEVVHDASRGGAIAGVSFTNGTGRNILREPVATTLTADRVWTDTADGEAQLRVISSDPRVVEVEARGHLRDDGGEALCEFTHLYQYRPMLVRRTCTYDLPEDGVACTGLSVGTMRLAPWLDEAATRGPSHRTTWHRAVFPGPVVFEENDFSQYMCLFGRGVQGIDWLPAAALDQWRGFAGQSDGARYAIEGAGNGDPVMVIEPIAHGSEPVTLEGRARFESYLSLPQVKRCLQRRNFVACLDTGQCTEEMLKLSADYGVTDIMLGAGNTPGTFEVSDEVDARRAVERATRLGLKIYPFDPFQLVNRRADIWEHHEQWARERLKNGEREPIVYSSYGDYFCPQAKGFRDALKEGYARLVESCDFTGLYHDFTHPYTCYNTRHYPEPHINTDGVLDVVLWDREYLGPDRVFCGHTGWVPTLMFQDLCTVSAIFEEYPASNPLPLHMTPAQGEFVNAAQMTLVSSFLAHGPNGPGEDELTPPPADLVDAYLARCALVGIFPWAHSGVVGATDSYDLPEKLRPWYRLFAIRGDSDLGTMQFLPYHRQTAVLTDNPFVHAATYWNAEEAIVVLANSESADEREAEVTILPEQLGWAAEAILLAEPARDCEGLTPAGKNQYTVSLPGYGYGGWHLTRR